jgi:hypothetical protein
VDFILFSLLFFLLVGVTLPVALLIRWFVPVRFRKVQRALLIAPFVIAAAPYAAFVAWGLVATTPPFLFHRVFDVWPAPDVRALKVHSSGDEQLRVVFITFETTPAGIARLVAPRDLRNDRSPAVETGMYQDAFSCAEPGRPSGAACPLVAEATPPRWWKPGACGKRIVYRTRRVEEWDEIAVLDCGSEGRVYAWALIND